ncbi:MAG: DUF2092 domain-containing protein [Chloroflexaceae bacterium]|nr:DUF2092 domain-containing protein [Chloroflexaceae bacterium]
MWLQFNLRICVTLIIACGTVGLSPGFAQVPDASPTLPSRGLRTTTQLLEQMCGFLKTQPAFTVELDITYDNVLESGEKVQYSAYQTTTVRKPDRLRSDYLGDERNTRFYYDGNSFTLFSPDLNLFATKAAPPTIDEAVENIAENYGVVIPLSNLFVSDPCAVITPIIQTSLFIGIDMVNRVEGYHILLVAEDRDVQVWIGKDQPPLLMKVVITHKNLPSSPQYTAVFSSWDFNPSISDETFTFTPGEGVFGVEFLLPDELSDIPTSRR